VTSESINAQNPHQAEDAPYKDFFKKKKTAKNILIVLSIPSGIHFIRAIPKLNYETVAKQPAD